jgi:putative flippase GtrA
MFQKALQNSLFRYIFVGGIAYVIDIVALIGLYRYLHTSRAEAAAVSFWAGTLAGFVMQKFIAFQDYQKELRAISKQGASYAILITFNYLLTIFIVNLFPGRDIVYSRTLAVAMTTLWNYVIYKKLVFRGRPEKNTPKDESTS